jgi:hypothetical protein
MTDTARQQLARLVARAREASVQGDAALAHAWFSRAWALALTHPASTYALAREPWVPEWIALLIVHLERPEQALRVARLSCAHARTNARCWLGYTLRLRTHRGTVTHADVWHAMTPLLHARAPRAALIDAAHLARLAMSERARRGWADVSRIVIAPTSSWPQGLHASVDHVQALAHARVALEHLSFHLAGEGPWNLTGYVPHPLASSVPQPAPDHAPVHHIAP